MARKIDPAKREAILDAGRKIFLRDGYASAKMSDIASLAGVAPGTLYLYFDSKEALAAAIGEDFFGRLSKGFNKVIERLDKPGGVENLVDFAIEIGTQERDLLALIKLQLPHPQPDCEDDGPRMQFLRSLADALQRLQVRQDARRYDPFALANVIMSIIQGMTMVCVFTDGTQEIKKTAVKVLQHILFEDDSLVHNCSPDHKSVGEAPRHKAKGNDKAKAKEKTKVVKVVAKAAAGKKH